MIEAVRSDGDRYIDRLLNLDKSTLPPDGGGNFNRLIFETSPYLLQHAENPVDWFPWGEEAFRVARREDKPVFLSIGYATCHWCHVMEEESFEDEEVAAVINRLFVPVKVDREERPDIDEQYMAVSHLMTGSGGWPLNLLLTPEKEAFFAVTYIPRHPRGEMPGIIHLLENLGALWRLRRDLVERNAAAVMEGLNGLVQTEPGGVVGDVAQEEAYRQLTMLHDPEFGGFGQAPKFPMPLYLSFLIRYGRQTPGAVRMADETLKAMRAGGIFDQIGYGLHRYSTDRQWLAPHFEKMLYDQALVSLVFLEAFQATNDIFHREAAREIFDFLAREMRSPEGGFYSALDADSEGEEGKYYLWTPDEVREALGEATGDLFCLNFDITLQGNFEGRNIPRLSEIPEDIGQWKREWGPLLERLRRVREKRIRPLTDRKILAGWNGLAIASLARGYALCGDPELLRLAEGAADFVLSRLVRKDGRLLRSFHAGKAAIPAFLEDYAFLMRGLIELYQATFDRGRLDAALRMADDMVRLFADPAGGGLFDAGSDAEKGLVRMKNPYDGVTPSANAVAAEVLIRLGGLVGDAGLERRGESILAAFMGSAVQQPLNHLHFIMTAELLTPRRVEIRIEGRKDDPATTELANEARRRFIPELILAFDERQVETTANVCAGGACRPPLNDPRELGRLLDTL